jgi:hypothetical protein
MFLTPIQMATLALVANKGATSAQDAANTLRRIEEQNKEALKRIEAQNLELQRMTLERRRLEAENGRRAADSIPPKGLTQYQRHRLRMAKIAKEQRLRRNKMKRVARGHR